MFSAFNPSKCIHTWNSDTAADTVQCLAQGSHLSHVQFLPEPRFEPTTSGYKSNALSTRPRLPLFKAYSVSSILNNTLTTMHLLSDVFPKQMCKGNPRLLVRERKTINLHWRLGVQNHGQGSQISSGNVPCSILETISDICMQFALRHGQSRYRWAEWKYRFWVWGGRFYMRHSRRWVHCIDIFHVVRENHTIPPR